MAPVRALLPILLFASAGCSERAPTAADPAVPDTYAEPEDPALRPRDGDQDCADFDTHEQAQRFFETRSGAQDIHGLDPDGDGTACEDLL